MSTTMTLSTPPGMIFGPPVREGNSVYNVNYSTIEALTQDVPALIERGFLPVDPYLRAMVEWVKIQGGNVPPTPEPFWEPFTITASLQPNNSMGYSPSAGAITNEPVQGYSLNRATVGDDGFFILAIAGPTPIGTGLQGALFGIGETTYTPDGIYLQSTGAAWTTNVEIYGVSPFWTEGQQVPIVIIPQGSPSV
jgi:hypothetical protein